jgi:hypothetical protein
MSKPGNKKVWLIGIPLCAAVHFAISMAVVMFVWQDAVGAPSMVPRGLTVVAFIVLLPLVFLAQFTGGAGPAVFVVNSVLWGILLCWILKRVLEKNKTT